MKTYELQPTSDKDLFRVVDRNGNWKHYFHEPTKKYLRSVNNILDEGYAKGYGFHRYLLGITKEEAEKKLKEAGDRGDAIHQFIKTIFIQLGKVNRQTAVRAEDNRNERILTDDEWEAILAFQSFWQKHQPKLIAFEKAAYNLEEGYAGTLDAIIRLTKRCEVKTCQCKDLVGKVGLYDWKSGGGIYGSYGAQVAAYARAENIRELIPINYTAILRIGTNHKTTGGYEFQPYDRDETKTHYREFMAARDIQDAEYEPFDPEKEIKEIAETIDLVIEIESIKTKRVAEIKPKQKDGQDKGGSQEIKHPAKVKAGDSK